MNEKVLWDMSYGVYIVTAWADGRPTGCTANSAMQITAEPATIAVSINHENFTNTCIAETGLFALNLLGENTQPALIGKFGFYSGRDTDKFDGVPYRLAANLPVLEDSCGYIVCQVTDKMETPTHTVFLGKVIDGDILKQDAPMSYAYYHKVIKGRAPKNAPTYLKEE